MFFEYDGGFVAVRNYKSQFLNDIFVTPVPNSKSF